MPENIPDALLYPERWNFYDPNFNAVKENMEKGVQIAGGLTKDEFAEHEEFMSLMTGYFERQKKAPEIGQYNPRFDQLDPKDFAPDFKKMLERNTEAIEKPEGDVAGDNLILNPQLLEKHLPTFDFKKLEGRKEVERNENYHEEVKIDPKHDLVRERSKVLVNIKKQTQRVDFEDEQQQAAKQQSLALKVNYAQVDGKVKGGVGIKTQV